MIRARRIGASLAFAAATATAVIAGGGYDAGLLQVALIAGPTLLPLLLLSLVAAGRRSWVAVACVLSAGWGATIAAEWSARDAPDASFAVLIGWAGAAIATVLAVALLVVRALRRR